MQVFMFLKSSSFIYIYRYWFYNNAMAMLALIKLSGKTKVTNRLDLSGRKSMLSSPCGLA